MKIIFTAILTIISTNLFSQNGTYSSTSSSEHEHHKNEIGIAPLPVYLLKEKTFSYGVHVHYTRKLTSTGFGVGIGYERIFVKHKHNTLGLVLSCQPLEKLNFAVSPGLTFEDKDPSAKFALHLETSYEFEIKNFHIGPLAEFAVDPDDEHVSLGFHIGIGF